MLRADREFYQFSNTKHGISLRNEYFTTIESNGGYTAYKLFGKIHRDDDIPAEICAYGTRCWWQNGKIHRDGDQPAVIYPNGVQEWWRNGVRKK